MKFLMGLLALGLSLPAFATTVQTGGFTSGGAGRCEINGDDGTTQLIADHLSLQVSGDNLILTTDLSSNVCIFDSNKSSTGQWASRSFAEPIVNPGFSSEPGTLRFDHQTFNLADEDATLWGTIDTQNLPKQSLHFSVPLKNFLSADEQQQLGNGQPVQRRLVLYLDQVETFQTATDTTSLGLKNGGIFYLNFTLSR